MGGACCGEAPPAMEPDRRTHLRAARKVPLAAAFLAGTRGNVTAEKQGGHKFNTRPSKSVQAELGRATFSDFTMCTTIGTGAFGCVKLCRHRVNGETCAMKITHKNHCATAAKDGKKYESRAIEVLTAIDHPFVIRTYRTFWEGDEVCTLMEVGDGGEFSDQIKRGGMDLEHCRFYCAEMALGLAALHELGISFHDFKPNNMLLSAGGHIKIIDFGLAAHVKDKSKRRWCRCCSGTPCYMAPEQITASPHDFGVDWWALGVVLYEMLCGQRPFDSSNRSTLVRQICSGKADYSGRHFPGDAKALCQALMQVDEDARLGARGVKELKKHPFFDGLSWDRLEKGGLEAPIVPGVVLDPGGGFSGALFAAAGGSTQDVNSKWFHGDPNGQHGKMDQPQVAAPKRKKKMSSPGEDFRSKHS